MCARSSVTNSPLQSATLRRVAASQRVRSGHFVSFPAAAFGARRVPRRVILIIMMFHDSPDIFARAGGEFQRGPINYPFRKHAAVLIGSTYCEFCFIGNPRESWETNSELIYVPFAVSTNGDSLVFVYMLRYIFCTVEKLLVNKNATYMVSK